MNNTSQNKIEKRVAEFVAACKKCGIKATHQRIEIMRQLVATDEHPDAESVYKCVRKLIPTISLDTVYRTLRMFEDNGIVSRVGSIKDRARFDANKDSHHHFVCSKCGIVRDFYSEEFNQFHSPPKVMEMGSVNTIYIELRGVCKKCESKKKGTVK